MDVAKDIAKYVEGFRKEKQAQKNAKQLFEKEIQRIKLILELKLSTFYDRVEGYTTPGDFLKQNKAENSYVFGDTGIALYYRTPTEVEEYLTAILNVSSIESDSYVFKVAFNGTNFYWEYKNGELTDEKFDEIMSEIIFGN
ncbi:hypothetical protein ACFTQ7_13170 [Lysinibacillus sp. NPDC056959]|uniref:hypothetical protein n=1 Tax=Lysinibacillus sp. NPDC056959 TaxID=3345981 RepID=UPI00364598E6